MSITRIVKRSSVRELIAVLKQGMPTVETVSGQPAVTDGTGLSAVLAKYGARMAPLQAPTGQLHGQTMGPSQALSRYHQVVPEREEDLDLLRDDLANNAAVETAYIKPKGETPSLAQVALKPPQAFATANSAPDFAAHQIYLGPAPAGVGAQAAWKVRGGAGAGVKIIDCEWSWNFEHEDLATHCDGAIVGVPSQGDDDHGTSVAGVMIGNANGFGVTGICPDAVLAAACFGEDWSDTPTSKVIIAAADTLSAGDILLLEIHRPGPNSIAGQQGQHGYIPIEWWPDDFHAISYATSRGILVVEAGGNGSQDLDDPIFSKPGAHFPSDWKNPLGKNGPDSGAIIVGAGNPPAGTHGRVTDSFGFGDTYVDRARCGYSNFGARVDCQGWGWEVTTTGSGDLYPGTGAGSLAGSHNTLYTDTFDGTSSASPMIAGVLACLQGAMKAAGRPVLTPARARTLLRSTGSPQQSAPGRPASQHIGSRPDLSALLGKLLSAAPAVGSLAGLSSPAIVGVAGASKPPSPSNWIAGCCGVGVLAVTLGMGFLGSSGGTLSRSPLLAWLIDIALCGIIAVALGNRFNNYWLGIATDWRNKISLSRLQISLWTILFAATFLVVFIWNAGHAQDHASVLTLDVPNAVWIILGISGISAIASPLILSQKTNNPPLGAPLPPPGLVSQGTVLARPSGFTPQLADLILGDELGNGNTIDVGKVQQILFGLVALIAYAVAIGSMLASTSQASTVTTIPAMSDGFLALIAASGATYLGYKAVPKS